MQMSGIITTAVDGQPTLCVHTYLVEHVEQAIVQNGMEPLHRATVECMECAMGCGQLLKPLLLLCHILQVKCIVWFPLIQNASGQLFFKLWAREEGSWYTQNICWSPRHHQFLDW